MRGSGMGQWEFRHEIEGQIQDSDGIQPSQGETLGFMKVRPGVSMNAYKTLSTKYARPCTGECELLIYKNQNMNKLQEKNAGMNAKNTMGPRTRVFPAQAA